MALRDRSRHTFAGLIDFTADQDDALLVTPALALIHTRLEIRHMGEQVQEMLSKIMPAILHGDRSRLKEVKRIDERVDTLHAEIGIEAKRETRAGDRGILTLAIRVRNQKDEIPLEYRSTVLLDRRES